MPKVIVIAGPTASGKSALAIDVARILNSAVLNCDSMQIYKNIPIISAAPSYEDKKLIEHKLYEIYECSKRGNVVEWLNLCVAEIQKLWADNKIPVVVGGTGMYIDALINGITPIPEIPTDIRTEIQQRLECCGLEFLYNFVRQNDATIAQKLNPNDKTRIVRAAEILLYTGKKVSEWYEIPLIKKLPEAEFLVIKILPDINVIEQRCRDRLDKMVELGALKEIEYLAQQKISESLPAMKALGVPELMRFIKGECSLEEALSEAKLHTRQYAKRQRTWLKNKLPADIVFNNVYTGQSKYISEIKQALLP